MPFILSCVSLRDGESALPIESLSVGYTREIDRWVDGWIDGFMVDR
jgi:hypothetical protein